MTREEREREPVVCTDRCDVDDTVHNGGIPPAVGVHDYQIIRANRDHGETYDGRGYTYNHQPMIAYWKNRFWVQYLASRNNEHGEPTETLLTCSHDGRTWTKPRVIFPAIEHTNWRYTVSHQRVGFYTAPSGRLLTLSFYGIPLDDDRFRLPNWGHGIGRAVREVYIDGTLGPIYWFRVMPKSGYDETPARKYYPMFRESPDPGFVEACDSLWNDKLFHQQMWEEDRNNDDGFFGIHWTDKEYVTGKALSYWTNPDGTVTGIWKGAMATVTDRRGERWSTPVKLGTIEDNTVKYWGQRTADGRYALVYSASTWGTRTPMVVRTGDDGCHFSGVLSLTCEIPPQRYTGCLREQGQQYFRGIVEGNGDPGDSFLWIVYSMNKEDIRVCRIPVPLTGEPGHELRDDFCVEDPEQILDRWNVYSSLWATVSQGGCAGRRALRLSDSDPYEYAKAYRIFRPFAVGSLTMELCVSRMGDDCVDIDLYGEGESRPVRLRFTRAWGDVGSRRGVRDKACDFSVFSGDTYAIQRSVELDTWLSLSVRFDSVAGTYQLAIDGNPVGRGWRFAEPAGEIRCLEIRTGHYRMRDPIVDYNITRIPEEIVDLPHAETRVGESVVGLSLLEIDPT